MIQIKRGLAGLSLVSIAVLGGLSLSACATEDYVNQRIAEVNTHISAVDAKATDAEAKATDAGQKADQALSAAQAAQASATQANQRIDALTATVNGLQQAPPPRRTPRG